jgi:hypothetical protein
MKTDVLADALLCIADDVAQHGISCGTQHRAARDLLLSRSPRLRSGAFEAQPGESAAQFAVRNALHLPDGTDFGTVATSSIPPPRTSDGRRGSAGHLASSPQPGLWAARLPSRLFKCRYSGRHEGQRPAG